MGRIPPSRAKGAKMPGYPVVPEVDILEAAVVFLRERGVQVYRVSAPKGKGINKAAGENRIWKVLRGDGVQSRLPVYPFSDKGQDIMGISATEWWQVECKGSGVGTAQTQRSNFDRALASAVSYYENQARHLPEAYQGWANAKPYLGLGLPASSAYLNELDKRVRHPLRKALNLWVLLYHMESKKIRAVSPEDSY